MFSLPTHDILLSPMTYLKTSYTYGPIPLSLFRSLLQYCIGLITEIIHSYHSYHTLFYTIFMNSYIIKITDKQRICISQRVIAHYLVGTSNWN